MTPLLVTVFVLFTNSHFSHANVLGQLPTQAPCEYKCSDNEACSVRYTGPARSGPTSGSCFPRSFGGSCSGTPPECQDCNRVLECSEIGTSNLNPQPVGPPQVLPGPYPALVQDYAQAFAQYAKAQVVYTRAQSQFAAAQSQAQAQFAEAQSQAQAQFAEAHEQAQAQLAIFYNRLYQKLPSTEAPKECVERPEIQPRNITFARLTDLRLTLTWSDCAETFADLNLDGDEEHCIYDGVLEDDSDSKVLVTGCADIEVQIHSVVIGDWLFTTKDGHALAIDMGDYDYFTLDTLENPEFENMFPIAEKNQRL